MEDRKTQEPNKIQVKSLKFKKVFHWGRFFEFRISFFPACSADREFIWILDLVSWNLSSVILVFINLCLIHPNFAPSLGIHERSDQTRMWVSIHPAEKTILVLSSTVWYCDVGP